MKDITIKTVLDKNGDFSHLELWQGNNVITLSLADDSLDVMTCNYKWAVLKRVIDKIARAASGPAN